VRIEILPEAREDLIAGFRFYERQAPGLGRYFRESILSDVDALTVHGGVHAKVFGYHRSLSKRFPFAIYIRYLLLCRGGRSSCPRDSGLPQKSFVD
jgi:hypothetical protein